MAQFREIDGSGTDNTPAPAPLPSGVISGLAAVSDGDGLGITISFTITTLRNVGTIQLLRFSSNAVNQANAIWNPNRQVGDALFDDRDAAIAQTQQWYWVRVWNSDESFFDDYGPVSATLTTPVPPPNDGVTWFDARHEPAKSGAVRVNVTRKLKAGVDFRSLKIYANGYKGVVADIPVAEDTPSGFSFFLQKTEDIITLKPAIVNSAGAIQSLIGVPTVQLYLGASANNQLPCRVTNIVVTEGQNGTEFIWDANPDSNITEYRLYRVAAAAPFPANVAPTIRIGSTQSLRYAIQDAVKGAAFNWYLTAANAFGESLPSDALVAPVVY